VQVFEQDNTDSDLGCECFHPEHPGQEVSTCLSKARAWTRCPAETPPSLIFHDSLIPFMVPMIQLTETAGKE